MVKHCTSVVYNGVNHCLGDACGPGGAGAIYQNPTLGVLCSRSNPQGPPAKHCTPVMYAGVQHCVGDQCGPGGAGSIMSNGYCSRSNVPSGGGGVFPTPNQVMFDVIQTLRTQLEGGSVLGAFLSGNLLTTQGFVTDNEACIRRYVASGWPSILGDMTRVPVQGSVPYQGGPDYVRYKNQLIAAIKANLICQSDGGGKPGGQLACHGGQSSGSATGGTGEQMACPGGGGGGGGGGAWDPGNCLGLAGINCTQLGLIGAVAIFGIFVLVVIKR